MLVNLRLCVNVQIKYQDIKKQILFLYELENNATKKGINNILFPNGTIKGHHYLFDAAF